MLTLTSNTLHPTEARGALEEGQLCRAEGQASIVGNSRQQGTKGWAAIQGAVKPVESGCESQPDCVTGEPHVCETI